MYKPIDMKTTCFALLLMISGSLLAQSTQIGNTGYPLQTNSAAKNRMRVYTDGKVSCVWIGSEVFDGAWADRGTFYNHYNGTTWGAFPTDRVEAIRTGFCELLTVVDREVVIAHDGSTIRLYRNTAIGSTTWAELPTSGFVTGLWPAAYCPSGTNDIFMVNANSGTPTAISFSRSDNGGLSWAVSNYTLPFLSVADGITSLTADAYQIAVFGNDVYVLYGSPWTDLKLLHSPNRGNPGTWTQTILLDFPINNYAGNLGQTSDYNLDGIADTIETTDQAHEMLITNDGTVHIWSGYYRLLDGSTAEGWSYFPRESGVWYWNSTMGSIVHVDLLIDWNNLDGLNDPFAGIGSDLGMYDGITFTSLAGSVYDETTGNIYLLYSMPIEYTDYFGDPSVPEAQSFRDIFSVYSSDNGVTWSTPVNLTNGAESFKENVFVTPYDRVVNGEIYAMWMEDNEPGTSLDQGQVAADPHANNKIVFQTFTPEDLGVPPACDIISPPTGLFADNLTPTSAKLHWNAVTGAEKYQVQGFNAAVPADKFKKKPVNNVTTITGLTPGSTYGFKVKTICPGGAMSPYSPNSFFTTPLKQGESGQMVTVYPNPSGGNITLQIYKETVGSEVIYIDLFSVTGQQVLSKLAVMEDGNYTENLALSYLHAGIYLVRISSASGITDFTIVIE